jgi:F0F1-type ATP synthase epsilon subunit
VANQITVNVVSAEKEIWSGKADMLVAKTAVGEIGLLPATEQIPYYRFSAGSMLPGVKL